MTRKPAEWALIIFLTGAMSASLPARAGEGTTGDYVAEIGMKFNRGLVNILSSPADIPCEMKLKVSDRGAAGLFSGFASGIVFMLRRILVGATEIGTFVIPAPRTIPPVCREQKW